MREAAPRSATPSPPDTQPADATDAAKFGHRFSRLGGSVLDRRTYPASAGHKGLYGSGESTKNGPPSGISMINIGHSAPQEGHCSAGGTASRSARCVDFTGTLPASRTVLAQADQAVAETVQG
jgi:hypothetical protein